MRNWLCRFIIAAFPDLRRARHLLGRPAQVLHCPPKPDDGTPISSLHYLHQALRRSQQEISSPYWTYVAHKVKHLRAKHGAGFQVRGLETSEHAEIRTKRGMLGCRPSWESSPLGDPAQTFSVEKRDRHKTEETGKKERNGSLLKLTPLMEWGSTLETMTKTGDETIIMMNHPP